MNVWRSIKVLNFFLFVIVFLDAYSNHTTDVRSPRMACASTDPVGVAVKLDVLVVPDETLDPELEACDQCTFALVASYWTIWAVATWVVVGLHGERFHAPCDQALMVVLALQALLHTVLSAVFWGVQCRTRGRRWPQVACCGWWVAAAVTFLALSSLGAALLSDSYHQPQSCRSDTTADVTEFIWVYAVLMYLYVSVSGAGCLLYQCSRWLNANE